MARRVRRRLSHNHQHSCAVCVASARASLVHKRGFARVAERCSAPPKPAAYQAAQRATRGSNAEMKTARRLWNAGLFGRLSIGFVVLLLSCCALGAFGSLIRSHTSRPVADLPPAFAASAKTTMPSAAAASTPADGQLTQPADLPTAAIVRVVDGDTVIVRLDSKDVRVRLIGIDTPEIVDPRKPVQCFAQE